MDQWGNRLGTRVAHTSRRFLSGCMRHGDMSIWSPKKRDERLNYMHNNPVKRGLVKHPGDRPWSSWRFFFWNDASILGMDKML
jgi:hypothetical protein